MSFKNIFITLLALTLNLGLQSAWAADAEVTYYHNDLLGSPVAATDEAGEVIWREDYNPFGEKRGASLEAQNDVGYTGHQSDDDLGLTYMQARYYDPLAGRFYGLDPQGFNPNNIQSFNRYAYANNNPYKYVDPNGESAVGTVGVLATADAATPEPTDVAIVPKAIFYGSAFVVAGAIDLAIDYFNYSAGTTETENKGQGQAEVGDCPTCGGNTSNKPGKIANEHGLKTREVKDRIYGLKNDAKISGNPDVEVCNDCGEVFPQTESGELGDSIGNIEEDF